MNYRRIQPHPALSNIVDYFGIQESTDTTSAVTEVLPTNQLDLLIHFGDPFVRHTATGIEQEPLAHLCGQRTRPFKVSATGVTGILMCSFLPWGVFELTGIPLGQFKNDTVPAEAVFPGFDLITRRILDANSAPARIHILQQYLLRLISPGDTLITVAANKLNRSGSTNIKRLASELGISKRHLDRKFIDAVGISPKGFSRVARFQRALAYRSKNTPAASVAALCGYYDQAHMHHEIKGLGGRTPGQLFAECDSTPLQTRFNASPSTMSRFYNTLYLQ